MTLTLSSQHFANAAIPALNKQIPDAQWTLDWWLARHHQKLDEVERANGNIDIVFLGDSITQHWEDRGERSWKHFYGHRNVLNLGFSGDRTEHILWRIDNGAVEGIQPKLLVLMAGTNNTGHRFDPAEETALGIKTMLDAIQSKLPKTNILLLGVFPRGLNNDDPNRQRNQQINTLIESFADNKRVFFMNINAIFLTPEGILTKDAAPDMLHITESQYLLWGQAIEPFIMQYVE